VNRGKNLKKHEGASNERERHREVRSTLYSAD
jgi:hypothetical protein